MIGLLKRLLSVMVVIMALAAPCSLMAQDSDLVIAARKLMNTLGNGKAAEFSKSIKLVKAAGLSYQKDLAAPRDGVIDCKDRGGQLQVLVGIYWTDWGYAFLFGKRDEAVAIHGFVHKDAIDRLSVRPKIKASDIDPAVEKRLFEATAAKETDYDALYADEQAEIERLIKAGEKDPDLMSYVVDVFYGSALEFMYLSCKLSLGAPGGEKLIPIFNSMSAQAEALLPTLESIRDPKLQALLRSTERIRFLGAVKDILQKKGDKLTADDLKGILKLVEPVRNSYIAKCK